MTLPSGAMIEVFGEDYTLVTVASPAAVNDGLFSIAADAAQWTNPDDTRRAKAVFETSNFTTAPDANSSIVMHARLMDIEGTNDEPAPSANYSPHIVCIFPLKDVTGVQHVEQEIPELPNSKPGQVYEFYWQNLSGLTMLAGWQCWLDTASDKAKA